MRTMASPTEALTTVSAVDVFSLALAEGRGGMMRSRRVGPRRHPAQQHPLTCGPPLRSMARTSGPFTTKTCNFHTRGGLPLVGGRRESEVLDSPRTTTRRTRKGAVGASTRRRRGRRSGHDRARREQHEHDYEYGWRRRARGSFGDAGTGPLQYCRPSEVGDEAAPLPRRLRRGPAPTMIPLAASPWPATSRLPHSRPERG